MNLIPVELVNVPALVGDAVFLGLILLAVYLASCAAVRWL